jgi:hypothetical protein
MTMLETRDSAGSPESELKLQQALRTLRALRQRYERARNGNSNACFLSIQVALGYTDMSWIAAAIEALEKATVPAATEDSASARGTSHLM